MLEYVLIDEKFFSEFVFKKISQGNVTIKPDFRALEQQLFYRLYIGNVKNSEYLNRVL